MPAFDGLPVDVLRVICDIVTDGAAPDPRRPRSPRPGARRTRGRNPRSAEAQHRLILEDALRTSHSEFRKRAARLHAATSSRIQGGSADLIREDRDSR